MQGQLPPRLFTVGRLDVATSGLLFVTNDGEIERGWLWLTPRGSCWLVSSQQSVVKRVSIDCSWQSCESA